MAETSFLTNKAKPKIIAKLKIIRTNINNIKEEDGKPFPNFKKVLHSWKELITQIQDIEGVTTRIIQEEQIKKVNNQITINNGQRVQGEQQWESKWRDMTRQINDNKNNILRSTRTTIGPSRQEEQTEEGEEEEEGQMDETVTGYFQTILEKLKTKKQQYSEFCSQWRLDCRAIAVTSLVMIAIGSITMIATITLTATTYDLNRRVNRNSFRLDRLYEYMDLRSTRREQEEDNSDWKERITIPNKTFDDFAPNPTRNRAQMIQNYDNLNKKNERDNGSSGETRY